MREVKWVDKSLKLNDGVELVSRIWAPKDKGSWPALLMSCLLYTSDAADE